MQSPDIKNSIHITVTRDGSDTLYSDHFKQHYHNPNGAVAESRHVFFEIAGVPDLLAGRDELTLFEMGFGTGLNLVLLLDYLKRMGSECHVQYYSIEAYPISAEQADALEFGQELAAPEPNRMLHHIFDKVKPGWNHFEPANNVTVHLFSGFFSSIINDSLKVNADLFFHDPFSPQVNGELWTREVFEWLGSTASNDAILLTYCAASSARAAMAAAGWHVARASGALGKREMTIAAIDEKMLNGFKRVNEQRLIQRYKSGEFRV
jgi:tRNA U34 5-methylaminomethyl-2-thiouridine-forming methyltransferase MnmC